MLDISSLEFCVKSQIPGTCNTTNIWGYDHQFLCGNALGCQVLQKHSISIHMIYRNVEVAHTLSRMQIHCQNSVRTYTKIDIESNVLFHSLSLLDPLSQLMLLSQILAACQILFTYIDQILVRLEKGNFAIQNAIRGSCAIHEAQAYVLLKLGSLILQICYLPVVSNSSIQKVAQASIEVLVSFCFAEACEFIKNDLSHLFKRSDIFWLHTLSRNNLCVQCKTCCSYLPREGSHVTDLLQ